MKPSERISTTGLIIGTATGLIFFVFGCPWWLALIGAVAIWIGWFNVRMKDEALKRIVDRDVT